MKIVQKLAPVMGHGELADVPMPTMTGMNGILMIHHNDIGWAYGD